MLLTQNCSDMFSRVKDLFHHAIRSQFLEVTTVTEVTVHNYFCLNFSMRAAHRTQRQHTHLPSSLDKFTGASFGRWVTAVIIGFIASITSCLVSSSLWHRQVLSCALLVYFLKPCINVKFLAYTLPFGISTELLIWTMQNLHEHGEDWHCDVDSHQRATLLQHYVSVNVLLQAFRNFYDFFSMNIFRVFVMSKLLLFVIS